MVSLELMDEVSAQRIMEHLPDSLVNGESWTKQHFWESWRTFSAAALFGWGGLYCVEIRGQLAGFVALSEVPERFLQDEVRAVEAGTYLLPEFRGLGWNPPVKDAILSQVFASLEVDWCVFVVSLDNPPAMRAFHKLAWPHRAFTVADAGPFQKFLKRRVWELSKPCILFAMNRTDTWLKPLDTQ